jgi:hypothetical protein
VTSVDDRDVGPDDFTDEELTALALSSERHPVVAPDAVPWSGTPTTPGPLPSWYMPQVVALRTSRTRRVIVYSLIAGFLIVDALGLCNTFGFLTWA